MKVVNPVLLRLAALAGAGMLISCAAAPGEPGGEATAGDAPAYDIAEAERRFDDMAASYPALNVVANVSGRVVWEREGGLLRDADDGVGRDYNFYSIAKMLTGMAFLKLEHEGAIDLDQSVRRIDENLPPSYEGATPRHLLNHLGGVRHYTSEADWRAFNDRRCAAPEDALGHFIEDPLSAPPGEAFAYTTYGFALLSHLLVRHTDAASFDDAMRTVLGDGYRVMADSDDAVKAVPYMGEAGAFEPIALSAECKFGGGGLIGAARDLALMGADLAAGDVAPIDAVKARLFSPEIAGGDEAGYAYGMAVGYAESIKTHYAMHSGGSPGGRGYLVVFFEPQVSVALTSNFDGPNHADLAIALARIFSGAPAEAKEAAAE